MPDIIDHLIITLGMDAGDFQSATDKINKGLDDVQKNAEDAAAAVQGAGEKVVDHTKVVQQAAEDTAAAVQQTGAAAGEAGKKVSEGQGKVKDSLKDTSTEAAKAADGVGKGGQRTEDSMRRMNVTADTVSKAFNALGLSGASPFIKLAMGAGSAAVAFEALKATMEDIYSTAAQGSAVGRAAFSSGINVSEYSAWGNAIQTAGGSASDAENTLSGLAQQQAQMALTGMPSAALQMLNQLGINPNEDPVKIMKDLAASPALRGMSTARQNALLTGQLGLDQGSAYAIEKGPDYVNKLLAQQADKGNLTPKQVQIEQDYYTAVNNLKQAFSELDTNLETDIMPGLTSFVNVMTSWVNWLDNKFPAWFQANVIKPVEDGTKSAANGPDIYTGTQQDTINTGMQVLQAGGMSKVAAAAFLGNAQRESSFNPHPKVDLNNPHYGLFQWSQSRRDAILKGTGIDVSTASPADQYKALLWETKNDPQKMGFPRLLATLNKMTDPNAAGVMVSNDFERPGDGSGPARGMFAQNIFSHALDPNDPDNHLPASVEQELNKLRHPSAKAMQAATAATGKLSAVMQAINASNGDMRGARNIIAHTSHVHVHVPPGSNAQEIGRHTLRALRKHHGQIGGAVG